MVFILKHFETLPYFGLIFFAYFSNSDAEFFYVEDEGTGENYSDTYDDGHKSIFDLFFPDFITECGNCECGVPNRGARVLGGEYVKTHEFPWLAMIQIKNKIGVLGTLINNRYILTSATQVIGLTPYDIKVTLGQYDRCFPDVTSQNVSASQIIIHSDFAPGNRDYDIALIRVSHPLKLEKHISPVCLSFPGHKYTGQVATVVGWAETALIGNSEDPANNFGPIGVTCRPRKAGLPILSENECRTTAYDGSYFSDDKGCIGIVGAKSIVCQSDAGGPVMLRSRRGIYEIIGLLSDKNDCTVPSSTALFTRISAYLEWIKRNTRDSCYCFRN